MIKGLLKLVTVFSEKIHVHEILKSHLNTLLDDKTKNASVTDYVLFYGIPLTISIGVVLLGYRLSDTSIGILLAAFAILTGFLFNLLVFLFELVDKNTSKTKEAAHIKLAKDLKIELIRQTSSNIAYGVLIGIILTVVLILAMLNHPLILLITTILGVFLGGNFMLTLLMILKRFSILLNKELD